MKTTTQLTKSQMRIAIARDAIKQIKAGRYDIQIGKYLDFFWEGDVSVVSAYYTKETLPKMTRCRVCQMGACLISSVSLFNTLSITANGCDDDIIVANLRSWFAPKQMSLMELAFECKGNPLINKDFPVSKEQKQKALKFGAHYRDDKKRSIAIFENLISNKGTFKP